MVNKNWKFLSKIFTLTLGCGLSPLLSYSQYVGQHKAEVIVTAKIPIKAYSFDLQDVRLLDSRFKDNMDREGKLMLSYPTDRLLLSFRLNAGIATSKMVQPLGGWEALNIELRGHSTGHLLSGLSLQYAATGNQAFKKKVDSLITGLAEVQAKLNAGGYVSAFPESFIDRVIAGKPVWAPWYTLHKITAGLIDAYWYTGNKQALTIANKMAAWAYKKLSPLSEDQLAVMLKNEFGGMNEAWYNLYSITGNPEHKKLGDMFYHHISLDPLARHEDKLNKMHANTFIPKITGEARYYELTGDEKGREIATYFWDNVLANQTYVTGSNSDQEHFIEPGKISQFITGHTGESCNTYNMLKLTRHLFSWNADVKYADYYERALYNHILGQQDPESSMVCYFTPLQAGDYRLYSTRDSSFWCCVGSGFESQSKFNEAIYYHNSHGVFVNLFIPSRLNWKEKGLEIRQDTKYPENGTTRLTIEKGGSENLSLYVRYPKWATNGATVKVNGKNVTVNQKPGSYITISRRWKKGDQVVISYPMSLRLEPTPDNPQVAAVMYGPLVLAGEMGTEGMIKPAPFSNPALHNDYYTYDYHVPQNLVHTLNISNTKINDCLKPVKGEALTFKTVNIGNAITMMPYYNLHRQRYVVYWNLN